jgi:SpoVK/Ycf46/Vps4 family AAA+-type ATPase
MGGSEDFLVSIIGFLQGYSGKALILLDNVEHILFSNEDSGAASTGSMNHLSRRCKSLFLYLMYSLKYQLHTNITLLIVATSYVMGLEAEFRCFDRTFYLQPPDEEERRTMFENFFYESSVQCGGSQRDLQTLLSELVDSTLGRSYAEITQYLRQATETLAASTSASFTANRIQALQAVRDRLQSVTPESLRQGSTENYVDIRVFSARELLCSPKPLEHETYQLPLLGDSALFAWKKLESSIIIPLCRSKQLNDLLDEKCVGGQKCLVGGVLLTGEPGSGKSEIAFHCAKYAAQLLPSFKLIEVSCTSLVHKEVGGSEKAVHHLFESARKAAPCLVVLDGIENIAAVRGNDSTTEGTMDRILSTLLVELDGIDESAGLPGGIAVIGITYDAQLVDPAIKRPGRLDRAVKLSIDWL